ncbi:hypothetical protein OB955_19510 [Halobacteria archaeon AArc-m2/3/4]|uniref:Uncharacterized protein n=1 Tax=Natronoglomus mannanivorans TaxID=2979990 RepID=A0AAP3E3D7_9EURY|nr:hypothetical protein [Halobacteria archaeon AArc-xg1-1]MCU4974911.1 hypothetical protein [Halobacteria archaeon AArc-m2/3/4]
MSQRIAAVVAAIIGACAVSIEFGTTWLIDGFVDGGVAAEWLPQLETMGQTAVAYSYASQVLTFVLTFVVVAALGYWAGTRLDVRREYGSLAGHLALGGGVGYMGGLVVFILLVVGWSTPSDPILGLGLLLGMAVATGIHFALVGLAGAALAEFGFTLRSPLNDAPTSDADPSAETK